MRQAEGSRSINPGMAHQRPAGLLCSRIPVLSALSHHPPNHPRAHRLPAPAPRPCPSPTSSSSCPRPHGPCLAPAPCGPGRGQARPLRALGITWSHTGGSARHTAEACLRRRGRERERERERDALAGLGLPRSRRGPSNSRCRCHVIRNDLCVRAKCGCMSARHDWNEGAENYVPLRSGLHVTLNSSCRLSHRPCAYRRCTLLRGSLARATISMLLSGQLSSGRIQDEAPSRQDTGTVWEPGAGGTPSSCMEHGSKQRN